MHFFVAAYRLDKSLANVVSNSFERSWLKGESVLELWPHHSLASVVTDRLKPDTVCLLLVTEGLLRFRSSPEDLTALAEHADVFVLLDSVPECFIAQAPAAILEQGYRRDRWDAVLDPLRARRDEPKRPANRPR
jgi:hypothetical protein